MNFKQIMVLTSTLISLFGIYWINAGKTFLKRTGEVAGREEIINYALPPGFIFSIWGVIYLGFLVYALYGLRQKAGVQPFFAHTSYLVAISIICNLLWTILVGFELWLAAYPLQWIMLAVAIILIVRWEMHKDKKSSPQKWLSIPFAMYAGWLTVAMIPFTSDLLNKSGWNYAPFTARTWAILIYVAACLIIFFAYRKIKNPFYILPLAWAFFGYFIRFDGELKFAAGLLMVIALGFMILQMPRFFRSYRTAVFTR